ncbi:hypothetical protein AAMO2058_001523200 [Amorphochlora amoebiformis]
MEPIPPPVDCCWDGGGGADLWAGGGGFLLELDFEVVVLFWREKRPPPREPEREDLEPRRGIASFGGCAGGFSINPRRISGDFRDFSVLVYNFRILLRHTGGAMEKKLSPLDKFHEYCTRGVDEEVSATLKANKSFVSKVGKLGNTALHWASSGGHTKVVTLLLEAKANINAQNNVKDTPLHMASWRDRVDVIKQLVEASADKTIKNQDGKTALQLGRSVKARDLLLTISSAEAKNTIVMAGDDDSDTE